MQITYTSLSYLNEVEAESDIAGILLVFPPFEDLCKRLRIPEDLRQRNGLLVALIPLKTNSSKYWELQSHRRNQPPSQILPEEILLLENRYLKGDSSYSRAVQILQCPVWLEETIGEAPKRTFCIWFAPFDGTQKNNGKEITAGTETSALITILERANADNVGYKSDVWFVFVHIGALKTLHKFEAFSDRRVKRPELQFITYGSHPTVPKNRWGINEIYIMGLCLLPIYSSVYLLYSRRYINVHTKRDRRKHIIYKGVNRESWQAFSVGLLCLAIRAWPRHADRRG